ncbi:hypothetical protein [Rhizobium halophytocola]|uniref:Uncharacterized protein n=1 Tax=Rhizobium halophytocola TaxID=735519 RepID=A0ABS4DVL4_9HYPH|nr:hypothetical protein [Rhizobium halophytocola]MBP1849737.1 hypothetical protein [Rhizobium halophytocola]
MILSVPAIAAISLGLSGLNAFFGKNRLKLITRKLLYLVVGFFLLFVVLMAVDLAGYEFIR